MAKQTINIGTTANDGTGDPLRTAFTKINENFTELYGADNEANTLQTETTPKLGGNLDLNGQKIVTTRSNESIILDPAGSGIVDLNANTEVTGSFAVSGAATLSGLTTLSSLKFSTGSTVTRILDEDTLSSNSDNALATQQSIKAYVDSQVTAQDLDFACDDSTVLSIDLDSEQLQFSGGTGITTAGTNNTVTIAIDATVATLTGSQTLTNKVLTSPTINGATMTGSVSVDNLTFNDNIISTSSNADLNLTPGGTGVIKPNAEIQAGIETISGTAFDINGGNIDNTPIGVAVRNAGNFTTVNANTSITADGIILKDNLITTADSNADLRLSAAGTGSVHFDAPVVFNEPSGLTVGNINTAGNTITATNSNGGITLAPNGTGFVTTNGTHQADVFSANTLENNEIEITGNRIQTVNSNADLQLGTAGTGVVDFETATQTTTGAAGGADALPATPSGYLNIKINGTEYVIPFYAKS
jgi:hypothetical protein